MTWREEIIGDARLILGDCRDVLPTLGKFDAVVTDPPYGIGENDKRVASRGKVADPTDYGAFDWDQEPPAPDIINAIRLMSRFQVVFGGNYFDLPPSPCWLVWDKQNTGDFADCELAWTNLNKAVRRLYWRWNGMIRKGHEERFHPTQKPLGVMLWCLSHMPDDTRTILDPFMGSGTTGVACVQRGLVFTGIEREPKYFDIACRRIEQAKRQGDLLRDIPPKPKPVQQALSLASATCGAPHCPEVCVEGYCARRDGAGSYEAACLAMAERAVAR